MTPPTHQPRRPPALLITFHQDGRAEFAPIVGSDVEQRLLASRLARLAAFLVENPSAVGTAVGLRALAEKSLR